MYVVGHMAVPNNQYYILLISPSGSSESRMGSRCNLCALPKLLTNPRLPIATIKWMAFVIGMYRTLESQSAWIKR